MAEKKQRPFIIHITPGSQVSCTLPDGGHLHMLYEAPSGAKPKNISITTARPLKRLKPKETACPA